MDPSTTYTNSVLPPITQQNFFNTQSSFGAYDLRTAGFHTPMPDGSKDLRVEMTERNLSAFILKRAE